MRNWAISAALVLLLVIILLAFSQTVGAEASEQPHWEVDDRPAPFCVEVPTVTLDVDLSEPEQPEEWTEPEYVETYAEEACCEPTCEPTYYEPAYAPSDGLTTAG